MMSCAHLSTQIFAARRCPILSWAPLNSGCRRRMRRRCSLRKSAPRTPSTGSQSPRVGLAVGVGSKWCMTLQLYETAQLYRSCVSTEVCDATEARDAACSDSQASAAMQLTHCPVTRCTKTSCHALSTFIDMCSEGWRTEPERVPKAQLLENEMPTPLNPGEGRVRLSTDAISLCTDAISLSTDAISPFGCTMPRVSQVGLPRCETRFAPVCLFVALCRQSPRNTPSPSAVGQSRNNRVLAPAGYSRCMASGLHHDVEQHCQSD